MKILEKKILFSPTETRQLILPAAISWFFICAISIVDIIVNPHPDQDRQTFILCIVCGLILSILTFWLMSYRLNKYKSLKWIIPVLTGFTVGSTSIFLRYELSIPFFIVAFLVVPSFAIFFGRWPTYLYILIQSLFGLYWYVTLQLFVAIRTPFDNIEFFIISATTVEVISILKQILQKQAKRSNTMSIVAENLISTLDLEEVIHNSCDALKQALDADTYYFGILEGDILHLKLLYDQKIFYQPVSFSIKDTFSGMIVDSGKPLKLDDLNREISSPVIQAKRIGSDKPSQSWMGAPIMIDHQVKGIVSVASYSKYAFSDADFDLLINISRMISIAMQNAIHHHNIMDLAQKDALTGTYNHNAVINALERTANLAEISHSSFSVIMLDVDNFKEYNDHYGHLIGDDVLKLLGTVMVNNIKDTDFVGRWGGEEFIICLPNTNRRQACQVAERIRTSMSELRLTTLDGSQIPGPTVSLGVAVYPDDKTDLTNLIDLADQRLYQAKNAGKNQTLFGSD